jgi:WD40 repeat protein
MYLIDNTVRRNWKSLKIQQAPPKISFCSVYMTSSALLAGSMTGELHIFQVETLSKLPGLKIHEQAIFGILASSSLDYIITAGKDNKIMVTRSLSIGGCELLAKVDSGLYGFSYCPFSSDLLYSTKSRTLTIQNILKGSKFELVTSHNLSLLSPSKTFKYVAAAGTHPSLFLMRTEVKKIETLHLKNEILAHFQFTSDETRLVASTTCGRLMIIDSFSQQILKKALISNSSIRHFEFTKERIFTVCSESLKTFDFDLVCQKTSEFLNPGFVSVTFDEKFLILVENWKVVKKVEIFSDLQVKAWVQDSHETCKWNGSDFFVSVGDDYLVRVWDSGKSNLLMVFGYHREMVTSISVKVRILVTCTKASFYVLNLENNRRYSRRSKLSIFLMMRNRALRLA